MKLRSIIVFLLISLNLGLIAQTKDSLSTSISPKDSTLYLNANEYAFMMHEETNFLVKANLPELQLAPYWGFISKLNLSSEFRIKGDFTAEAGLDIDHSHLQYFRSTYFQPFVGIRWYYSQHKRRKSGDAKLNMSGNYIGLEGVYKSRVSRTVEPEYEQKRVSHAYELAFKWGMQRRFLQHGLIDVGLRAGMEKAFYEGSKPSFFIQSDMNFALALAKDKKELNKDLLCPILLCHENRGSAFKINMYDILSFRFTDNGSSIRFQPNISYEKRLWQLPLSIQADIESRWDFSYAYQYLSSTITPGQIQVGRIQYKAALQTRYYHNLNKRVLKGLSGDGLSANYFGFEVSYENWANIIKEGSKHFIEEPVLFNSRALYKIKYGIQRFYGKHFYFDYALLLRLNDIRYMDNRNMPNYFEINLAVGYRF